MSRKCTLTDEGTLLAKHVLLPIGHEIAEAVADDVARVNRHGQQENSVRQVED